MPTVHPETGAMYASMATIRQFILEHYVAVGGLAALGVVHDLETRILAALYVDGEG